MATSAYVSTNFPQLKAEAFDNWLFRVQCLLEERGLKEISNATKIGDEKKLLDSKAKSLIVQCLTDRHLNLVKDASTSKEMLDVLKSTFQRKSVISKITLRRKLLSLKHTEGSLEEYFAKFDNIIRELECSGEKIEETDKVCYLLTGLDDKYDNIITAIETVNTDVKLEFVRSKLLDHEIRNTKSNDQRTPEQSQTSFVSQPSNIICYKCKRRGHKSYECRMNSRGRGRGFRGPRGRGGSANSIENENTKTFIATEQAMTVKNIYDDQITFIVDSGATHHFIQEIYEDCMTTVEDLPHELYIKIANGQILVARKKGIIEATYNNEKIKIEVVLVPGLSTNLMSVGKLVENGMEVSFKYGKLIIKAENQLYYGAKEGKLYTFKARINKTKMRENAACKVTIEDNNIWHKRFGHMCRKNLAILRLPYSNTMCDVCMKNKATRLPFRRLQNPRSSKIGELIHTDIAGPMRTPTKGGNIYYQTIIDDFSHFTQTYLLKNKWEATENLITYIKEMERQNEVKVKRIRCDNGGEFTARTLKEFCWDNGIKIEYTQSYSPQQNGKAERMNRTIYDKARVMLDESCLPRYLWGNAVLTATYLINRSPCSAINNRVPAKVMNREFNLEKIKVFGCKAWVHIMPRQDKLSSRATQARMIGYAANGYKLWDPMTDEVIISRDVRFDETDIKYEEKLNIQEPKRYIVEEIIDDTAEQEQKKEQVEIEEERQITEKESTRRGREVKKPQHLDDYKLYEAYCLFSSENDPTTYKQAIEQSTEWKTAVEKEIKSLEEQQTWIESELPKGCKTIDTKWIFKTKSDGTRKARLVARGFQQEAEDFVYAPVAKMTTIRMGLSQALNNDWDIKQLDIPTAFLNGKLKSEVFISVPEGVTTEKKGTVLKLKKALYGLKESPRCWNERFNEFCEKN